MPANFVFGRRLDQKHDVKGERYEVVDTLAAVLNTVHNLAFYLDTMRRVRQAIDLGRLAAFLSEARSHGQNSSAQLEDPG